MSTLAVTTDTVLRLLRELPPRERLHVVAQVLPELERDLPAISSSPDFWDGADVRTLAERQSVQPIKSFDAMLGGWPDDEPIEDFLQAIREWRRQNLSEMGVE
jgi:hypothetical protein